MATQREAERLTGLQAGGISALALLDKGFDVLLDETARSLERIHISAGRRGTDIELRVDDLVALTSANYVEGHHAEHVGRHGAFTPGAEACRVRRSPPAARTRNMPHSRPRL